MHHPVEIFGEKNELVQLVVECSRTRNGFKSLLRNLSSNLVLGDGVGVVERVVWTRVSHEELWSGQTVTNQLGQVLL